jgi:hypothetical protein
MPTAAHCKLESGVDYCTVVQAVNEHGLVSDRVRSSGSRVCFNGPSAGVVYDVSDSSSVDIDFVGSAVGRAILKVQWDHFVDDCAGIDHYHAELQEASSSSCTCMSCGSSSLALWDSGTCPPPSETCGPAIYPSRGAASPHCYSSAPATCSCGVPRGVALRMPSPDSEDWLPSHDLNGVGSIHNIKQRVANFTLGPHKGFYRVKVCAVSVVGLTDAGSCAVSDGVLFETSPPAVGQLCVREVGASQCAQSEGGDAWIRRNPRLGAFGSVPHNAVPTRLRVSSLTQVLRWKGFHDPESMLQGFSWALGSSAFAADLAAWQDVEMATSTSLQAASTASALPSTVYFGLRCTNRAGLTTEASYNLLLDMTAPTLSSGALAVEGSQSLVDPDGRVFPPTGSLGPTGVRGTVTFTLSKHAIRDDESDILHTSIRVYEGRTGSLAQEIPIEWEAPSPGPAGPPPSPPPLSNSSLTNSSLMNSSSHDPSTRRALTASSPRQTATFTAKPHTLYRAVLLVRNGVGIESKFTSRPFMHDPTPPVAGTVRVCDSEGSLVTQHWQTANQTHLLQLCLEGFLPSRSGISGFQVHLHQGVVHEGELTLQGNASKAMSLTYGTGPLQCGHVELRVAAFNGCRYASPFVSTSFDVVCDSPQVEVATFATRADLNARSASADLVEAPLCLVPGSAVAPVATWLGSANASQGVLRGYQYALTPQHTPLALANWSRVALLRSVTIDMTALHATRYELHARACSGPDVCGQRSAPYPLVLASSSPTIGEVDLNATASFTAHPGQLVASWTNVTDATDDVVALDIEACVGTTPYGCQTYPFVAIAPGRSSWQSPVLPRQCGATFYVTIRATNCAGLQSSLASPRSKLCCDPPTVGSMRLLAADGEEISSLGNVSSMDTMISWSRFADPCSDIHTYEATIRRDGTTVWTVAVDGNQSAVIIGAESGALLDGADVVEFVVTATSHAGLSSSASKVLKVDTTAPQLPTLAVAAGTSQLNVSTPTCIRSDTDSIDLNWAASDGFGSGIAKYEVALASTTHAPPTNADPEWRDVGLATSLRLPLVSSQPAQTHYFAVRACDQVGLCTALNYTSPFVRLTDTPTGGTVVVAQAAAVVVNGSRTDASPRLDVSFASSSFSPHGCPRKCGAFHCYYDHTCSDAEPRLGGIGCNAGRVGQNCRVCSMPPTPHAINAGVEPLPASTTLDLCPSPSAELPHFAKQLTFEACVGTTKFGCQALAFVPISVDALTGDGKWRTPGLPQPCGTYYVTVRASNCAGLQHVVASAGTEICCKPPTAGSVQLLGNGSAPLTADLATMDHVSEISWAGFGDACSGTTQYLITVLQDGNTTGPLWQTTSTANSVSLPLPAARAWTGKMTATVTATNSFRLVSEPAHTSFTVYTAPVSHGAVVVRRAGLAEVHVHQSTVRQPLCVPVTEDGFELDLSRMRSNDSVMRYTALLSFEGSSPGQAFTAAPLNSSVLSVASLTPANLTSSSHARVHARGCNAVEVCVETRFNVSFVAAAPTLGPIHLVDTPKALLESRSLHVLINESGASVMNGPHEHIVELATCVGTTPYGCQTLPYTPISIGSDSWQSPVLPRQCGATFYVTLRATNCGGLQSYVASEGSRLCCTPPTAGSVELVDAEGRVLHAVSDTRGATLGSAFVQWSGFEDACSTIEYFDVHLASSLGDSLIWSGRVASHDAHNASSSIAFPVDASLPASSFTLKVSALNAVGLASRWSDHDVLVDISAPQNGTVYTGVTALRDAGCQNDLQPFHVSWSGFVDDESEVEAMAWAIGTAPFATDIKPFAAIDDGASGSMVLTWSPDRPVYPGMTVFSTLRATNGVGLSTSATSYAVRIVDSKCPSAFLCLADSPRADASSALAPNAPHSQRRLGQGTHPLFALAVLSLDLGAGRLEGQPRRNMSPDRVSVEYDVTSSAELPRAGRVDASFRVRLTRLGYDVEGAQLVQMKLARGELVKSRWNAPADMPSMQLHRYPLFFRQDGSGRILSVHHHPQEKRQTLALKRVLLSAHQIVLPPNDGVASAWSFAEIDSAGPAVAEYTGHDGFMQRRILKKRVMWSQPTPDRPESMFQVANITAIVDKHTGLIRHLSSSSKLDVKPTEHASEEHHLEDGRAFVGGSAGGGG